MPGSLKYECRERSGLLDPSSTERFCDPPESLLRHVFCRGGIVQPSGGKYAEAIPESRHELALGGARPCRAADLTTPGLSARRSGP